MSFLDDLLGSMDAPPPPAQDSQLVRGRSASVPRPGPHRSVRAACLLPRRPGRAGTHPRPTPLAGAGSCRGVPCRSPAPVRPARFRSRRPPGPCDVRRLSSQHPAVPPPSIPARACVVCLVLIRPASLLFSPPRPAWPPPPSTCSARKLAQKKLAVQERAETDKFEAQIWDIVKAFVNGAEARHVTIEDPATSHSLTHAHCSCYPCFSA